MGMPKKAQALGADRAIYDGSPCLCERISVLVELIWIPGVEVQHFFVEAAGARRDAGLVILVGLGVVVDRR